MLKIRIDDPLRVTVATKQLSINILKNFTLPGFPESKNSLRLDGDSEVALAGFQDLSYPFAIFVPVRATV